MPDTQRLELTVTGQVLTPDSEGFDSARLTINGRIDRRPAVIVRCADADDVAAALHFARAQNLEVAVRGGGHSSVGFGTVDGGLVIDTSTIKGITVDASSRIASVGAGLTWRELDAATQRYGLAVTGGRVSTTGVSGVTLGGGTGWLERKLGATVDSLLAVDLVLVNGERVRADANHHTDLFWAVRGGGGNFGIAVSFTFQLHLIGPELLGGLVVYPREESAAVVAGFRDAMADAPDDVGAVLSFLTTPPNEALPTGWRGRAATAVALCYGGGLDQATSALAQLRTLVPERLDLVRVRPYVEIQQLLDAGAAPGLSYYGAGDHVADLDETAVADLFELADAMTSPLTQLIVMPWSGAMTRIPAADTAYPLRDPGWVVHPSAYWTDPADEAGNLRWVNRVSETMRRHGTGRAYVNLLGDEGSDRVRAAYGSHYERLSRVKRAYDPDNVLHLNQNIQPSSS